jgi:peptidoglycan L-alanyl-D-glutamate endopeptidase CwlK
MPNDRKLIFDAAKELGAEFHDAQDVAVMDKAIDAFIDSTPTPIISKPAPAIASTYQLSQSSLDKLAGVKPELVSCVKRAIGYTLVDFGVSQGARTLAEQIEAVKTGHSRTMHSKHLPQADGMVWAVDLVAYINGAVSWEFNAYGAIACAMDRAATELGIASHVRWGCAWDRVLSDFGGDAPAYLAEAKAYSVRHAGSDLLDAPHFEWVA